MRPDVVIAYCAVPNVLCGLMWRTTGARLCIWNQQDLHVPARFRESTFARSAQLTPLVVALSDAARRFLVERLGVDPRRIRMIHNSAVLPPARESGANWRARLDLASDALVVVMLANLNRHKDHATLLRAWRLVLDRIGGTRETVLLIAGRPAGTEDAAKAVAYDLDLRSSVRFLGDVDDVAGLLQAVDVGVLSSHGEGYGRALQECMVAGLPVAGTDVEGIREAVGGLGARFLAAPGDVEGLADRLLELLRDKALRTRLGEANAVRARFEWSFEHTTAAYSDLVVDALRMRGGLAGDPGR
jgi:glycosyltransferase involved in cell wall biosynthesis